MPSFFDNKVTFQFHSFISIMAEVEEGTRFKSECTAAESLHLKYSLWNQRARTGLIVTSLLGSFACVRKYNPVAAFISIYSIGVQSILNPSRRVETYRRTASTYEYLRYEANLWEYKSEKEREGLWNKKVQLDKLTT